MIIRKELGKITSVEFELHDHVGALGLILAFQGRGWGTFTFIPISKPGDWLRDLLLEAGIYKLTDLNNKPVEVTFTDGVLTDWRILIEVL